MNDEAQRHILIKSFCIWLGFAFIMTICCGLAYFLVRQDIRISANYPQSQLAEDTSPSVENLALPVVNIAESLAPFVSTFDVSGKILESDAVLDGKVPTPPPGVFDYARSHGQDRFTWQLEPGVRIATVLVYHGSTVGESEQDEQSQQSGASNIGFVLAGRSLREVENLESQLATDAFFVWLFGLVAVYVLSFFIVVVAEKYSTPISKNPLILSTSISESQKVPIKIPVENIVSMQVVGLAKPVQPPPVISQ